MALYQNFLNELPFHDLDPEEFIKATGAWVFSLSPRFESKDLFRDIIESPEREDDLQKKSHENYIESKYYSIKQTGNLFDKAIKRHGFSISHFNMRGLSKNLSMLQDLLYSVRDVPDVIAITETKLTETSVSNISIPGYVFLNTNSKTSPGELDIKIQ